MRHAVVLVLATALVPPVAPPVPAYQPEPRISKAWSLDWQYQLVTGTETRLELPDLSIDDFVFRVAAIGAGSQESLVSACLNPSWGPADRPRQAP